MPQGKPAPTLAATLAGKHNWRQHESTATWRRAPAGMARRRQCSASSASKRIQNLRRCSGCGNSCHAISCGWGCTKHSGRLPPGDTAVAGVLSRQPSVLPASKFARTFSMRKDGSGSTSSSAATARTANDAVPRLRLQRQASAYWQPRHCAARSGQGDRVDLPSIRDKTGEGFGDGRTGSCWLCF